MGGEGGGGDGGGGASGGEFDGVDDAQLEQFAFGRQGRVYDRELAEAALLELIRRGTARAAAAGSGTVSDAAPDIAEVPADRSTDTAPGSPEGTPDANERHRRRMRTTGIVAATSAALALIGIAPLLSPENRSDPLAIFEQPAGPDDAAWAAQLTRDYVTGITLGPRSVDLGNGATAIVFRSAATLDGRSTAFDPYCLWVSEGGSSTAPGSLSGTCTLPERFVAEGLRVDLRPSTQGGGLDVVTWGPTGSPRLNRYQAPSSFGGVRSVLDWLVFPSTSTGEPRAVADDLSRVLMGPSIVPLNDRQGVSGLDLTTWAYLEEGRADDEPVLCIVTYAGDPASPAIQPRETRTCAPLSVVRRQGLAHTVTSGGLAWEVLIGPDGEGRSDRVQPADGPR